jgi:intracellular septation protein
MGCTLGDRILAESSKPDTSQPGARPVIKLAIELGPLLSFLAIYAAYDIYAATATLMVATVIALLASRRLLGHVPAVLIITAVLVVILGGVTLWLRDPRFIKVKPTIINLLFAGVLLAGFLLRRPFLKIMLGETLHLTEAGWRQLTLRWAVFFITLAALNELIWRNFSESVWVNFKVFGMLPLTFLFALLQLGLIKRHEDKTGS